MISSNFMHFLVIISLLVSLLVFGLNWRNRTKWWLYLALVGTFIVSYIIMVYVAMYTIAN